ncbi:MAG: hypothetical protein KIS79_07840 [Burkholderiales bacterium]|nr:hypothetical protein [Burkholderiales bacterium]
MMGRLILLWLPAAGLVALLQHLQVIDIVQLTGWSPAMIGLAAWSAWLVTESMIVFRPRREQERVEPTIGMTAGEYVLRQRRRLENEQDEK